MFTNVGTVEQNLLLDWKQYPSCVLPAPECKANALNVTFSHVLRYEVFCRWARQFKAI